MQSGTKKNLLNIFLILIISVAFLIWQFRDIHLANFVSAIEQINFWWLLIAFACMLLYWGFEALVLYKTVNSAASGQTFLSAFRITMAGQFFNMITPMQTGGQPAQLYLLAKKGMDAGATSSVLLIKFVIYQAMIVINFIFILIFGFHYLNTSVTQVKLLVFIGFIVHFAVIACLILISKSQTVTTKIVHFLLIPIGLFVKKETRLRWESILDEKIISFHEESKRLGKNRTLLLQSCFYTTLQLWLYFAIPYFILRSLGITEVGLYMAITYHAFIIMFATVMPTPGGVGGAEYTFTLLFGPVMISAKLLAALLIWRVITYYSCIIFGAAALMFRDKQPLFLKKHKNKSKQ